MGEIERHVQNVCAWEREREKERKRERERERERECVRERDSVIGLRDKGNCSLRRNYGQREWKGDSQKEKENNGKKRRVKKRYQVRDRVWKNESGKELKR